MKWEKFNYTSLEPIRWSNLSEHKALAFVGLIIIVSSIISIPIIVFLADFFTSEHLSFVKAVTSGVGFVSVIGLLIGMAVLLVAWSGERTGRINAFVTANKGKISFSPMTSVHNTKGAIFFRSKQKNVHALAEEFSGGFTLDYAFGNLLKGGKNVGYIRMKLPRRLPHMILDATKNNTIFGSNLPVVVKKNQGLSLEGDFDNHYRLYVPTQYEQDALYIFTPDIMSLLIGSGAKYDVELVGDDLFLYHNRKFDLLNKYDAQQILWLVEGLGEKLYRRVDGYRDDRVTNAKELNEIAKQGKELYQTERASVTYTQMSYEKQKAFTTLIVVLGMILVAGLCFLGVVIKATLDMNAV